MKIAVIAPTPIPSRRANTIQVMKMTHALVAFGHDVRLAAPHPGFAKVATLVPGQKSPQKPSHGFSATWDELAHHYGITHRFPITWLPVHPRLRSYDYGYRAIHWARNWGADLIYTRLPQAAAIASMLGMATVLEAHDLPQGILGPRLFSWFLRGKGARRLVVISQALANDLTHKHPLTDIQLFLLIAPDGVDLDRYDGLPDPEMARGSLGTHEGMSLRAEKFVVGYTGHLYPGRGVEMILAMAARLPDISFLLVGGESEDVARVREQAEDRRLENVVLTGFVPNAELPRYQAACDVLLMPYQKRVAASSGGDIASYLSPMKVFEYIACGRVILSSDLPVLQEILTLENAILLPHDDVDAWVKTIQDLQANPENHAALAAQARRDVENYTWAARVERILEGL